MTSIRSVNVPLIPLPRDTVLLPGVILRIPVANNPSDIPSLLARIYSRTASKPQAQRLDNIHIACVPLRSPILNRYGQKLIKQDERNAASRDNANSNSNLLSNDSLFGFGVAAKITGIEGRGTGEFALLIEGVARIKIERLTRQRPFFEADVVYEYDPGWFLAKFYISVLTWVKLYHRTTVPCKECLDN